MKTTIDTIATITKRTHSDLETLNNYCLQALEAMERDGDSWKKEEWFNGDLVTALLNLEHEGINVTLDHMGLKP